MEETHKPPYESCWSLKVIQVAANRRGFGLTLAVVHQICVHRKVFFVLFHACLFESSPLRKTLYFCKRLRVACWPCAVYTRLVRHACVCAHIFVVCVWLVLCTCVHKCTQDACRWWIRDHWWRWVSLSRLLPRALVPQTVTNSILGGPVLPRVANHQPGFKNMSSCSTRVSHSFADISMLLPCYWRAVTSSDHSYSQKPF